MCACGLLKNYEEARNKLLKNCEGARTQAVRSDRDLSWLDDRESLMVSSFGNLIYDWSQPGGTFFVSRTQAVRSDRDSSWLDDRAILMVSSLGNLIYDWSQN